MRTSTVSSSEACELAGVTYRQLDYWTRAGIVTPYREARGSGTARRWTIDDVELIRVVGRLAAAGVDGDALRHAAGVVCDLEERVGWLVVEPGGRSTVARTLEELAHELDDERAALVVVRLA